MKYLKNFFHIFGNSLFPTDKYYLKIPQHTLGFSLRYFFVLVFMITFFTNMATFGVLYPEKNIATLKLGVEDFLNDYPKDLKVDINKGVLSTNFTRPYIFWWVSSPNPIIVIDEMASLQKLVNYKSLVAFNKTEIVTKNYRNNDYQITTISKDKIVKIDYSSVQLIKKMLNDLYKLMPFLWIALIFLAYLILPFILTAVKITYLILASFFVFLVFKFINNKLEFFKTFQLALHASTLPTILGALVSLSVENIALQGLFFGLTMIFTAAAVYEVYIYKEPKQLNH